MKFLLTLLAAGSLAACGARSEEQQIREVLAQMEAGAEARDASDVLAHVAADYEDAQGFDRERLTNYLRGYLLTHPRIELHVDIGVLEFPADGLAQAEVAVTNLVVGDGFHERFKVELRREGGRWLLRRADRVEP